MFFEKLGKFIKRNKISIANWYPWNIFLEIKGGHILSDQMFADSIRTYYPLKAYFVNGVPRKGHPNGVPYSRSEVLSVVLHCPVCLVRGLIFKFWDAIRPPYLIGM